MKMFKVTLINGSVYELMATSKKAAGDVALMKEREKLGVNGWSCIPVAVEMKFSVGDKLIFV